MKSGLLGILVSMLVATLLSGVSKLVRARRIKASQKSTPFECGFDPYGNARQPFSLHFFLMAIIFLLFDLEIALLYPVATIPLGKWSESAFMSSYAFLAVVYLGLIHEWNQGSLEWK